MGNYRGEPGPKEIERTAEIEMLRVYSKGFLENVTIEELTPGPMPL
jgi:hypothetical protein